MLSPQCWENGIILCRKIAEQYESYYDYRSLSKMRVKYRVPARQGMRVRSRMPVRQGRYPFLMNFPAGIQEISDVALLIELAETFPKISI